jgi:hypothetical protein
MVANTVSDSSPELKQVQHKQFAKLDDLREWV